MGKSGFRDLLVWQKAKDLAVKIYLLPQTEDLSRDRGLRNQARRSAVSIASNLAEGDERDTDREAVRFFFIAKGSLAELRTQLQIAAEARLLMHATYETLEAHCAELGKMIGGLIRTRQSGR